MRVPILPILHTKTAFSLLSQQTFDVSIVSNGVSKAKRKKFPCAYATTSTNSSMMDCPFCMRCVLSINVVDGTAISNRSLCLNNPASISIFNPREKIRQTFWQQEVLLKYTAGQLVWGNGHFLPTSAVCPIYSKIFKSEMANRKCNVLAFRQICRPIPTKIPAHLLQNKRLFNTNFLKILITQFYQIIVLTYN